MALRATPRPGGDVRVELRWAIADSFAHSGYLRKLFPFA